MKKRLEFVLASLFAVIGCYSQITLDYCISKADENYPLIKKYDLVEQTRVIELSDINRQWWPSVNAYVQANVQNNVPEFPSPLTDMMAQMGNQMRGLGKIQYKIGMDLSQTVWDGGASKAKRKVVRASNSEQEASVVVTMYAMHERVISLFFAALLTSEQMKQQEVGITLLEANLKKMEKMLLDGTAMKSDVDNVKAQMLTARQKLTEADYALNSYNQALEIFIGESIQGRTLVKPSDELPSDINSNRPELTLFQKQKEANNSRLEEIKASVMPKIGVFAQAFYGYPGFNNFESMMNRQLSFNVLGGIRASWALSPLYTKRNSIQKISLANDAIESERETFLFNSNIKVQAQQEEIEGIRKVMESDQEITALRTNVRKAAEAQLENGVIDTFTLLAKITDEIQARLDAAYHEMKLINAIYQLKYTINR